MAGFVVDKVVLGQVFLQVLQFLPVSIIPPWLSILIHHLEDQQ
jgi:branched-subunit amino acid transport protein